MATLIVRIADRIAREYQSRTDRGKPPGEALAEAKAAALDFIRSDIQDLPAELVETNARAILQHSLVDLRSRPSNPLPPMPPSENPAPSIVDAIGEIVELNGDQKTRLGAVLHNAFHRDNPEVNALDLLDRRLDILYQHEKRHLDLLKDYKEEIKFARTMEEDLRRERATFFAQTLRDVSTTLKQADVGDDAAAGWIRELVNSYTASLDVSSELAQSAALDHLGDLQQKARSTKRAVEADQTPNAG